MRYLLFISLFLLCKNVSFAQISDTDQLVESNSKFKIVRSTDNTFKILQNDQQTYISKELDSAFITPIYNDVIGVKGELLLKFYENSADTLLLPRNIIHTSSAFHGDLYWEKFFTNDSVYTVDMFLFTIDSVISYNKKEPEILFVGMPFQTYSEDSLVGYYVISDAFEELKTYRYAISYNELNIKLKNTKYKGADIEMVADEQEQISIPVLGPEKYDGSMFWEIAKFEKNYKLLQIEQNGKYGMINGKGEEVIPFEYDAMFNSINDGQYFVAIKGKTLYFNSIFSSYSEYPFFEGWNLEMQDYFNGNVDGYSEKPMEDGRYHEVYDGEFYLIELKTGRIISLNPFIFGSF